MQYTFPTKVYNASKKAWSVDKKKLLDASDAAGIGLFGVRDRHSAIAFAPTFAVSAPGPRALRGARFASPPSPPPPPVAAPATAIVTPALRPVQLHDAYECTLVPGCSLPVNHPGTCDAMCGRSPRTPGRTNYATLAGKRPRDA